MVSNFYFALDFPQCVGALAGTLVGIKMLSRNAGDYIKKQGYDTLNVQTVADYNYRLFDVNIQ